MPSARRDALGDVLAGCELKEISVPGAGRHHYFTAVLRDRIGNVWECEDHHADRDEAQGCARAEFARRVESGELKTRRRIPAEGILRTPAAPTA